LLAERITDTKHRAEEVAVFVGPLLPELRKAVFENVTATDIGESFGYTQPHTTKADTSSGMATAMSGRGSGAVVFACRSVMVLNPMTPEDAKKAGLQSPSGYFSAKDDKQNLTLKTGSRDWYKMEGVSLGNGGQGNLSILRADNIGVTTRWQWPSQASFVEEVTGQQLQAIKDRLKAGAYRKDSQAKAWAGYVVGEVLGLGSTKEAMEGHDRQRIARMLDTWVKDRQLEVYEQKVNREFKEFVA
ncbi:MAG: hypothetical protein ACXWC8_13600, partial [Limisphaerales bacterium]